MTPESAFPNILLTLAVGGMFGLLFMFLKFPNGLRIGSLFGAALLNIFFKAAFMPSYTQYVVQMAAGALIGCTIERSDIRRLPTVVKPTVITLGTFLVLNLSAGALIHALSPLDWVTSLMSAVPGGITDTPIIAVGMGADTPKVALLQLARYILGVALFPPMILAYDNFRGRAESKTDGDSAAPDGSAKRERSKTRSPAALAATLAAGTAGAFIGYHARIPAGTFLMSMLFVMALKLKFDFAYFSPRVKKAVLLISGCYIGSLITMKDIQSFALLLPPLFIILGGYVINCFVTGKILTKVTRFNRKEAMLTTTPAGASDIALSSADIGVQNTDIIIIQIFRAIVAVALFPQIINLLLLVLPE